MITYKDELCLYHHGIKGQRWGVRRYQNENGSLTAAGKRRYSTENINALKSQLKKYEKSGDKRSAKDTAKEINRIEKERDKIDTAWMEKQVAKVRREHADDLHKDSGRYAHVKTAADGFALRQLGTVAATGATAIAPPVGLGVAAAASIGSSYAQLRAYNKRRAPIDTRVMNRHISSLKTPTGRSVKFVEAKWYNVGINGLFDTAIRSKAEFRDVKKKG